MSAGPDDRPRRRPNALRPLEIAHGMPVGLDAVAPLTTPNPVPPPIDALEGVMVDALSRPPCLVSFSGGRDSSALLAVAASVARRLDLPLPVPATLVFPDDSATREDEWQRTVLDHLELTEWIRITIFDDLDAVGPVATQAFERHGLLWPFNAHFHLPIIERATGGTVVTGFGGDELARASTASLAERILTTRRLPSRGDVLVVGLALSPRPIRRAVYRQRTAQELTEQPWLTSAGRRELARAIADTDARLPLGWHAKLRRWVWADRYFRLCTETFALMGSDRDVAMVHPFVHPAVLVALAADGGFRGYGDRTQLMASLFGHLLPDQVVRRPSKASFTDPLWTPTAMSFARAWHPKSILDPWVESEALQAHWLAPSRNLLSTTLLQAAWMIDHGLPWNR